MGRGAEAVLGAPVVQAGVEFGAFDADTHLSVGDLDVESREERGEELAADVVGQLLVERGGIFEEIDEREGLVHAVTDAFDRPCELLGDGALLERHVLEALAQLLDGDRSVGGEFDEPLLLGFELLQLRAQGVLLFLIRGLEFHEGASDFLTNGRDVLCIEALSRDPSRHLVFEFVESRRRHQAVTALLRGANVVLVRAAMPLVLAVDESTRAPLRLAFGAVQQAAQEVKVDPVAVSLAVASVEDLLHREEQLLRDERRVPARMELALVADDPGVIRVAQNHGELTARQRLGGSLARLPRGQALVFQHHLELRDRELVRGVLLEGPDDEWCADGVDVDRVDEASVEVLAHVEVAELGSPDASASFDLVGHLDADVLAAHADLEFIDDVGDGFHRVAHVAVAEVLLGRDELDAGTAARIGDI
ncbi:MAG: hypothetical protein ABS64_13520 [Microbacterium sp. SCN 69-37]|nr:MAG: hypothetical protein ABS64_13520 [Microbacterium sp. SCN 69-37]